MLDNFISKILHRMNLSYFCFQKSSAGGGSANQSDRGTTAGKSSKSRKGDKTATDPTIELNPEEGKVNFVFMKK